MQNKSAVNMLLPLFNDQFGVSWIVIFFRILSYTAPRIQTDGCTLTPTLLNAKSCVMMTVHSFLPYVRLMNEGQWMWEAKI